MDIFTAANERGAKWSLEVAEYDPKCRFFVLFRNELVNIGITPTDQVFDEIIKVGLIRVYNTDQFPEPEIWNDKTQEERLSFRSNATLGHYQSSAGRLGFSRLNMQLPPMKP